MKKCIFLIVATMLIAVPLRVGATVDTLLVANGSTTNAYVPIYGYWADDAQHNQMIYPASMLDDMIGQNIIGLSFFITGSWNCNAVIRIGVVSDSTLTTHLPTASLTEVWSGMWTSSTAISFTSAYAYTGGNLLVDIQTQSGNYGTSSATGIERTAASLNQYGSNSAVVRNFLPKAQFIYTDQAFCDLPTGLTFDAATGTSLTFHWTPGGTETSWDVMVGDSIIENVSTTTYTVNNLVASSLYNVSVRAICGTDNYSAWSSAVSMATGCASITSLPWFADFEGALEGTIPVCWATPSYFDIIDPYSGGSMITPAIYTDPSYYSIAYSGVNSVLFQYMNYYGTNSDGPAIIASPYIVHNPTDLHVSFYLYIDDMSDGSTFEAGIMTDPTNTATFIPLLTYSGTTYPDPSIVDFYTSSLTGLTGVDSVCVAFRASVSTSADYLAVAFDAVTVDAIGSCTAPTLNSGSIDSISYESVDLSWQCAAEPESFDVILIHSNGSTLDTVHYEVLDTTIQITPLLPNTAYSAYVASVCYGDTTDYTYIGMFTTHLRCYSVQNPSVVALTANAAAIAWNYSEYGIEPASVEMLLSDLSDTNVAPVTVSVFGDTSYTFTGLSAGHQYQVRFLTLCGTDDSSAVVSLNFLPVAPPCAEVDSTLTSNSIPFNCYYKNGFSESLYDASIVSGIDTIRGITFKLSTPRSRYNTVDIYMGYTSLNNLTTTNYVSVSQLTHVVSNYSLYLGNAGWTDVIPFDTLFVPQPTGDSLNLLIAVYNHTSDYNSGLLWSVHTSTIGTSVFTYTDNSSFSVDNPFTSGNTSTNAPNIQLYGDCSGDCVAPSVTVNSTDTASVTLTWLPGGMESSWTVQYRLSGTSAWITAGTATTQPYVVMGLATGSNYQFRVGSNCTDTVAYSSAVSAYTACGIVHAPVSILPDGTNHCWTFSANGSYDTYDTAYEIFAGGTIISPALADTISTLQVVLEVHGSPYYVGVCDADGQNITWIDTIDPVYDYVFKTKKTYLDQYNGIDNHIIIKSAAAYSYTYIHSISIEPLESCFPVDSLTLDSVNLTEAWLSWVSDGSSFEVQYLANSDSTATWQTTTVSASSVHLTGLNSADRYYIKVFNVCSATERSDSVMMRIATGCAPYTTPFVESFGLDDMPSCWSTAVSGVEGGWEYSALLGEDRLFSEADISGNPSNDWLMTPVIQMPANANYYQIIYYLGGEPYTIFPGSAASCELRVSTTGSGDTSAYTTILRTDSVNTYNSTTYDYDLVEIRAALDAYAGQQVSFAFVSRSRYYGILYLDDVQVRETVTPLYTVSGATTAFTGDTIDYYAIYQEGSLDSMTFQWLSTMEAAGQAVMLNSTTDSIRIIYSAEGVDTITFIATNQYGADTVHSIVYVYNCAPVVEFPFHEGFETEEAPVGCWYLTYGDNNPEVNPMIHTDQLPTSNAPTTIPEGMRMFRFSSYSSSSDYNQYLISREFGGSNRILSFQYAKYSNYGEDQFRVGYSSTDRDTASFIWRPWINPDSVSYTQWKTFTDSMPDGARYFAIQYWGSCDYYLYIDDLTVDGSSPCLSPVIGDIVRGENNLVINYTADAPNVEVIVTSGTFDPAATGVVSTSSPFTATGLSHSTAYTIAMRSICGAGVVSDWTVVSDSTLTVDCQVPTNLTIEATTYTSTTVGWTSNGIETAWNVRAYNTVDTFLFAASTNPYTIIGLTSGVTYNIEVRALCGQNSDIEGDWSDAIQVTTNICAGVDGVHVTDIASDRATVNWQPATGSIGYRIYYGIGNFNDSDAEIGTAGSDATSYTMTGLYASTAYEVYLVNVCTESGVVSHPTAADRVGFTTAEATEGIYDIEAGSLTLFPNPAASSVTVTVSGFEGEAMVEVVDMNGRTVSRQTTANYQLSIDVSNLAQGAYFVRVTGDRQTAVRKLIVR